MEAAIIEPNWNDLGDKELAAHIKAATGEIVEPGNMAHAALVAMAQRSFSRKHYETKPGAGPRETAVAGAARTASAEADARAKADADAIKDATASKARSDAAKADADARKAHDEAETEAEKNKSSPFGQSSTSAKTI